MKHYSFILTAALLVISSVTACNRKDTASTTAVNVTASSVKSEAQQAASKPAADKTADAATEVTIEIPVVVGITECDLYISKYRNCITKMPAEAASLATKSLDEMISGWKAAATSPETKAALGRACQQARAAAKASINSFGCEW